MNIEEPPDANKDIKELIKRNDRKNTIIQKVGIIIALLGFAIALFAIGLSFYLSEDAKLIVWHELNETKGRLSIYVTNDAIFKETGIINLYRLEVNDAKPHMQVESLKPGETKEFGLEVNITEENIPIKNRDLSPGALASVTFPYYKLYFATDKDASISYKITCDNCKTQGTVRRIPAFDVTEGSFGLQNVNNTLVVKGYLKVYKWIEFDLENIIEIETAFK